MAVLHHARKGIKHLGSVSLGGGYVRVLESFNRPNNTTSYSAGDLIADNTTANLVIPLTFHMENVHPQKHNCGGIIQRVGVHKSGTGGNNDKVRVHFYHELPMPANGDNGAWLTSGVTGYLGAADVTFTTTFSDGLFGDGLPNVGTGIIFEPEADIYVLLEAMTAYTPVANELFSIEIQAYLN